jgi:hypothetical protein
MKRILFLLIIPFLLTGCSDAQTAGEAKKKDRNTTAAQENVRPKVDIKVNKVYDDNGNLIRYDSTYVWSYSNVEGDSVTVVPDSIMYEFKPFIHRQFPDFEMPEFNDFLFTDSAFYHDFFTPDYFYDRWRKSMMETDRIFREMDSLKNLFFQRSYPGLQKPKK